VLVTPPGQLQGVEREDLAAIRATRAQEPWYADATAALEALEHALPVERPALERQLRPFWYGHWDERCQQHAASADRQTSKRALLGFAAGVEPELAEGLVRGLSEVRSPVLVVAGERDALTGVAGARAVAACFPDARVEVLPRAGHFPWVDEPAAFRSAVSGFLGTM
jgi:pimeloyl-ACP methyl ester carboxylesterase